MIQIQLQSMKAFFCCLNTGLSLGICSNLARHCLTIQCSIICFQYLTDTKIQPGKKNTKKGKKKKKHFTRFLHLVNGT